MLTEMMASLCFGLCFLVLSSSASETPIIVSRLEQSRLLENQKSATCFSLSGCISLDYFQQGYDWDVCVSDGQISKTSDIYDKESVMNSNINDDVLTIHVHPALYDAPENATSCLPTQAALGKCTFRSAIALCAMHLTSNEKNCTIKLSSSDYIVLDFAFGPMQVIGDAQGHLSIEGNNSVISLSDQNGAMRMLYATSSITGYLKFSLKDCEVSNFGNVSLSGGAIYLSRVIHTNIINCTFVNNTGLVGGAVYLRDSNSHVNIWDCIFIRNHAEDLGGGLYIGSFNTNFLIKNNSFYNNTAFSGGGFFTNNENYDFLIIDSLFAGNIVSGIGGGGFVYSNSERYEISHCEFIENTALNYYAGGLYLYSRNKVELHYIRFIGNRAMYGGGLNGDSDNDYSLVSNCYFEKNVADFGGALTYYASHVFMVLQNSTFHMNHAAISGGAMYFGVNNDGCTLQDLVFTNNTAAVLFVLELCFSVIIHFSFW